MRWIFRILGLVAVLIALAVGALFLLPTDRIATLATDQLQRATGRAISLEGDVRPSIWPELGIKTGPVTVANADWSENGPMLKAEGLSIGVDTAALWGGAIRVKEVQILAPVILLERRADGTANWAFGGETPAAGATTEPVTATADETSANSTGVTRAISLDQATIRDGRVIFVDYGLDARTEISDIDATAELAALDGPAALDLTAVMNGQSLALNTRLEALGTFLSEGATGVTAEAKIGGSTLSFDGRAGVAPLAAGGAIDLDLADKAAVFGLIGVSAPDLPQGLGQRIQVRGDMTYTETGVTLRGATVTLDDNAFAGDLDVVLSDRPKLTARLTAGALDLSSLTASAGGGATGAQSGDGATVPAEATAGWPKDPIDVSALQSVDADVDLTASAIDLGVLKLGATRVRTTLDAGRAVTEIGQLDAYGGSIGGSFVVNSRGGLSARATLSANQVAIQPLLQDLAGYNRLIATGDVSVNLLAVGNSMDALMRSLEGDVAMAFGTGELLGLDLVGMLRNLDPSFVGEGQRTIFDGLSGTARVQNGVAVNEDLLLDARLVTASGTGRADVGNQTVDYRLRPKLLEGQTNGGLAVPLLISGPWSNPKFQLDLEALAEEQLADEVEAVKAEAERAILDKIEEETGVKADDLEAVDEAVKDAVEDAIKDEIGNALDGLFNR